MRYLSLVIFSILAFSASSADHVVEEFGLPPAFSTIQSAIDAAADGDRIFIKNRAGDIPYLEDLTVDKSIELLSYENDTLWHMQGDVTISQADGREVAIIGMKNYIGDIQQQDASGSGMTNVKILNCRVEDGYIFFVSDYFTLEVVHTYVGGPSLSLKNGDVIGCELWTCELNYGSTGGSPVRTNRIIGNKIRRSLSSGTQSEYGIQITSSHAHYEILNNYVVARVGIWVDGLSLDSEVKVYNNTIHADYNFQDSQSGSVGIVVRSNTGQVEVMNNVIEYSQESGTESGIVVTHNSVNIVAQLYYNHIDSDFGSQAITGHPDTEFNNVTNQSVDIDADGRLLAGNAGIDGGNPGPIFYDLDLTPGDAGAYGGSYTLDNFHPIHFGAARLYFVDYPFNIRQGSTLDINASGYDR